MTYYTILDKPANSGNFSFQFYGEVSDLLTVTIRKTGSAPVGFKVAVISNGRVLRSEDDLRLDIDEVYNMYLPGN
jgi:hypothetical protein